MQQCTYITEQGQCQTLAMEGYLMCGPHETRSMLNMSTEVEEAYDKRMDFYGTHTDIPTVLDAHPPVQEEPQCEGPCVEDMYPVEQRSNGRMLCAACEYARTDMAHNPYTKEQREQEKVHPDWRDDFAIDDMW